MLERMGSPPYHPPPNKNLLLHTHTPPLKAKKLFCTLIHLHGNLTKICLSQMVITFLPPPPQKYNTSTYPKGNSGISAYPNPPLRIMTPLPTPKEQKK